MHLNITVWEDQPHKAEQKRAHQHWQVALKFPPVSIIFWSKRRGEGMETNHNGIPVKRLNVDRCNFITETQSKKGKMCSTTRETLCWEMTRRLTVSWKLIVGFMCVSCCDEPILLWAVVCKLFFFFSTSDQVLGCITPRWPITQVNVLPYPQKR